MEGHDFKLGRLIAGGALGAVLGGAGYQTGTMAGMDSKTKLAENLYDYFKPPPPPQKIGTFGHPAVPYVLLGGGLGLLGADRLNERRDRHRPRTGRSGGTAAAAHGSDLPKEVGRRRTGRSGGAVT